MILKVYIRKHLFHLPRKQDDLTDMIKEKFYKRKPLVKSGLTKMYRISDIENNNIQFEKDVNIFLINLYLLVLEHGGKLKTDKDIQINLSDENIKNELSKMIDNEIIDISIEEIEQKVDDYLTKKQDPNEGSDKTDAIKSIEFSMEWVKKMDNKLRE